MHEADKKGVLTRLKRVSGQAQGLVRMVEDDQYCVDVLQQIAAVQGALAQVSKQLLRSHLKTCVVEAFESEDRGDRDRAIEEIVDLFAKDKKRGGSR